MIDPTPVVQRAPQILLILWVAFNAVGVAATWWLSLIAWERYTAVGEDPSILTIRAQRLQQAAKQLRNRATRFFFHVGMLVLGLFAAFNISIPHQGTVWALLVFVTSLAAVSTYDLYREMHG